MLRQLCMCCNMRPAKTLPKRHIGSTSICAYSIEKHVDYQYQKEKALYPTRTISAARDAFFVYFDFFTCFVNLANYPLCQPYKKYYSLDGCKNQHRHDLSIILEQPTIHIGVGT